MGATLCAWWRDGIAWWNFLLLRFVLSSCAMKEPSTMVRKNPTGRICRARTVSSRTVLSVRREIRNAVSLLGVERAWWLRSRAAKIERLRKRWRVALLGRDIAEENR